VSWLDQLADHVEELRQAGYLQQNGRSAEALPILDRVLSTPTDPASPAQAAEVSRRISAAAAAENWQVLVPGTPIGLAAGWSEVDPNGRGLSAALAAAAERRSPA
jgi:hypothetical protein